MLTIEEPPSARLKDLGFQVRQPQDPHTVYFLWGWERCPWNFAIYKPKQWKIISLQETVSLEYVWQERWGYSLDKAWIVHSAVMEPLSCMWKMQRTLGAAVEAKRDEELKERGLSNMAECLDPNRRINQEKSPNVETSQEAVEKREI